MYRGVIIMERLVGQDAVQKFAQLDIVLVMILVFHVRKQRSIRVARTIVKMVFAWKVDNLITSDFFYL